MSVELMAKKTAGKKAAPKSVLVNFRASEAFRDWMTKAAEHCGFSVADLIVQGVRKYAKDQGFDEPPPKR